MALWIHNITPGTAFGGDRHRYAVKLNNRTIVEFDHSRSSGAADCFRAAADALDAGGHNYKHNSPKEGSDV